MCRMIEVGVDSSNLNSNDTFILIAHDQATCWIGKGLLSSVILRISEDALYLLKFYWNLSFRIELNFRVFKKPKTKYESTKYILKYKYN